MHRRRDVENQKEYIEHIKENLKKENFTVKCNTCFKIENNIMFIVGFHKRADGIYNTQVGLTLDLLSKPSIKNMQVSDAPAIGLNIDKEDAEKNYNKAILDFIIKWFKDRDTIDKIKVLLSKNALGLVVSPLLKNL